VIRGAIKRTARFTSDLSCRRAWPRKTIDVITGLFQLRNGRHRNRRQGRRVHVLSITSSDVLAHASKACARRRQYQEAVRDVRLLLEGRNTELADTLEERMMKRRENSVTRWPRSIATCAGTVIKLSEQQKMATVTDRDVDIFAYYREGPRLALQLFTMREAT